MILSQIYKFCFAFVDSQANDVFLVERIEWEFKTTNNRYLFIRSLNNTICLEYCLNM